MFTVIAWSESVDNGGVILPIAGVPDQHVKVVGDVFNVPMFDRVIGAAALVGASATVARLVAPSIRRLNPYQIAPMDIAIVPTAQGVHSVRPGKTYPLDVNESLSAEHNGNPAAAEQTSIVAWLADSDIAPVGGQMISIRATITATLLAGVWVFADLTLVDDLPVGAYNVVGAELVAAAGVAFRFVPVGSTNRPGALCVGTAGVQEAYPFRYGDLGVWFSFQTVQLPGIEVLASSAPGAATYQLVIDVMPA